MSKTAMFGSVEVTFDEESHRYRANGKIIPGVTSILNVLDKPLLKQWAADKASKYWLDEYIKATAASGIVRPAKDIYDEARKEWTRFSNEAADFGTAIHKATELFDGSGDIADFSELPEIQRIKAINMLQRYIDWRTSSNLEIVGIEDIIYSDVHKYAGQYDRIFKRDGKLILADIKTSKVSAFNQKGVYDNYLLQLGGYAVAIEEQNPDMKIEGFMFINPDKQHDTLEIFELDGEAIEDSKQCWLATLQVYKTHHIIKKHNNTQNSLTRKQWWASKVKKQ